MSTAPPNAETWRRALTGDRDAFNEALAPHTDTLRSAADRQLEVERDPITDAPEPDQQVVDLTPDELVGETMVRAWDLREQFDADRMSFRAWLLGLQTRSLAKITQRQERYARRKAVSLDEEIPTNETQDAVGEQFYEFRQPFDVDTYEEIIASTTPDDPAPDGYTLDDDAQAEARQGALLFDEFDVSLAEVAQILDASLKDTAASLSLAREGLRSRIGSIEDAHDDDPAIDSYTGDPLPDA